MHPFALTVLPVHLAKRMVENRGGEAEEIHERLHIKRNGEYLAAPIIHDDCVDYLSLCAALAVRR